MIRKKPTALDIIEKKVSTEGYNIPRELLVDLIMGEVRAGQCYVFQYGSTVFTVQKDADRPELHMYSDNAGMHAMKAYRQFMKDVWGRTGFDHLTTIIKNRTLQKWIVRTGWRFQYLLGDFSVYRFDRRH